MSDVALKVENLGKKYIIGHQDRERYTALRDVLTNQARSFGKRVVSPFKPTNSGYTREEFWALKDVSFEVKKGDVVGIIGRNGAGKSTLLKILSRITEPTTGRITLEGQVASLLEVGTGFHPELTGRENIFLNGAILGMSRAEIKRKFDEIVDFAEIEKFLDTPVKRYSSGMYVRLAFAVAAHMEPEILVVDEVLAVGDAAFQKKCLGKMEDVATKEGRTVLFVSHNMGVIENLCKKTVVLSKGQVKLYDETKKAINLFQNELETQVQNVNFSQLKRSGTGIIKLIDFTIENSVGQILSSVSSGENITLAFHYKLTSNRPVKNVSLGFSIHNSLGDTICILYSDYQGCTFSDLTPFGKIKFNLNDLFLSPGRYLIGARITVNDIEADWPSDFVGYLDVESGDFYNIGRIPHSGIGPVLVRGTWNVDPVERK